MRHVQQRDEIAADQACRHFVIFGQSLDPHTGRDILRRALLPRANWAQLFLAIDHLSREGAIELRWFGHGEYLLTVRDPG